MQSHASEPPTTAPAHPSPPAPACRGGTSQRAAPAPARVQRAAAAAGPAPLARALARAVAARAVDFKTPEKGAYADVELVRGILLKHRGMLVDAEQDGAARVAQVLAPDVVREGLARLRRSSTDYGTFDLTHEQDVAALYFELRKHVVKPKDAPDPGREVEESRRAESAKDDELWRYRQHSPDPIRTYELALLGTGAAIAYYLTSAKGTFTRMQTVVIGKKQPWAEERGPGVVNHPMHMITALREELGEMSDRLASRSEFSEIVARVIDKHVGYSIDAEIRRVTKIQSFGTSFYKIEILRHGEPVAYYARRVVAGLGIGPHLAPRPRRGAAVQGSLGGRAMNMDEFQRRATEIQGGTALRPDITVVITGPNAGLDAVKTAMDCGFRIVWVTGSGRPGFLPGTDNELVEAEYDKNQRGQPSQISAVIKDYSYQAEMNPGRRDPPVGVSQKPIVVDIGRDGAMYFADYFVWAPGPDVNRIRDVFADFATFVPTYDKNRQFGAEGLATVVGLQAPDTGDTTSLELIGGSAFRLADKVNYGYLTEQGALLMRALRDLETLEVKFADAVAGEVYGAALARDLRQVRRDALAHVERLQPRLVAIDAAKNKKDVEGVELPPLQLPDFSLILFCRLDGQREDVRLARAFLSTIRQVARYRLMLDTYRQQVIDYYAALARGERAADPRSAGGRMGGVIASLPLNVLVNDQLTPTRSQVEATAAFVPGYVRDSVNFATDSATVLQIHISSKYPYLSDAEVNDWVAEIMRERRPENATAAQRRDPWRGPLPNPRGAPRFTAEDYAVDWTARLERANARAKAGA